MTDVSADDLAGQLADTGRVELSQQPKRFLGLHVGPPEPVLVVSIAGVRLVSRGLDLPWDVLGPVFGWAGFNELEFGVSAPFWESHIADASGAERQRAMVERGKGWPVVVLKCRLDTEAVAQWLTREVQQRARLPRLLCLSPAGAKRAPLIDQDSRRDVPLDRLRISPSLGQALEVWNAKADEVAESDRSSSAAWERFAEEGRHLAVQLTQDLDGQLEVRYWADLPDVS